MVKRYLPFNNKYHLALLEGRRKNRPLAQKCDKDGVVLWARDELNGGDMDVYFALLNYASKRDDFICWPSHARLREQCGGIDKRTLQDHISALEQMEFITVERARGMNNRYFMRDFFDWLCTLDGG